jgi:hypothetical protein
MEPRLRKVLFGVLDDRQAARLTDALQPLLYAMPTPRASALNAGA